MENLRKKSVNNGLTSISRVCILLIIFILTAVQKIQAQAESGPSLDNIRKNNAAATAELERMRQEEIMSYVYMSLGFAVVIAIAWGTTIMARKRSRREQEEKHRFILKQQEMKKHHHHGHGLHKARR